MSNSQFQLGEALGRADDSYRTQFTQDSVMTVELAMILLDLQAAWSAQLEQDRIAFIMQSLNPDPAASSLAKAMQIEYQDHATQKDIQCNAMQSNVDTVHQQLNLDNANREKVTELGDAVNGLNNQMIQLLKTARTG